MVGSRDALSPCIDERQRPNLASNLKSVTTIFYKSTCILLIWSLMMAYEATTASKQPQRSNLILDVKSVTLFAYISMCSILIILVQYATPARGIRENMPP